MRHIIVAVSMAIGLATGVSAQDLAPPSSEAEAILRRHIPTDPQGQLDGLLTQLGHFAAGGVYNLPLPSQVRAVSMQRLREQAARHLQVYDTDRDGEISAAEVAAVMESGFEARIDEMTAILAVADADGDRALNPAEIEVVKDRFAERNIEGNLRPPRLLRGIDPAVFDMDGDGKLRRDDLVRYVELVLAAGPAAIGTAPPGGNCRLPPASSQAVVTLVGGHGGGAALSDHSLAGQDVPTQVVYLDLPDGQRPVYLLLRVSGSTIYQLSGDLDRIEHVVVGHVNGTAGVDGLARDRISFVPMEACFAETLRAGGAIERREAASGAARALGHQIDRVIVTPFLKADVVTGALTDQPAGPRILTSGGNWKIEHTAIAGRPDPSSIADNAARIKAQALDDFLADFPLGLKTIPEYRVISPASVVPYVTLPGAAGLNAWLASGIAVATGRQDEVVLRRPVLRWPGGLGQARPLTVLLPDTVPMPGGDPGSWTILSADRSRCLAGRCPP